jgi:hypothetical protein
VTAHQASTDNGIYAWRADIGISIGQEPMAELGACSCIPAGHALLVRRNGHGDHLVSIPGDVSHHGDRIAVIQELVGALGYLGQVDLEAASTIGGEPHGRARDEQDPPMEAQEFLRRRRTDQGQRQADGDQNRRDPRHEPIVGCEAHSRQEADALPLSQPPARLMTMDVIMRATPGKREIHQGGVEVTLPPSLIPPHDGVGG